MTLPSERSNSLDMTEKFLMALMDAKATPRAPRAIRERAKTCLRHFPTKHERNLMATKMPELFWP